MCCPLSREVWYNTLPYCTIAILAVESLLVGVLSNKKSVANFPGGDRHGGVRPSAVRSFYHHEALSEGHQPPWLLFLRWYMYRRKIYFFFFKTGCGSKNPLRRKIGNYFAWGLMEQGLYHTETERGCRGLM